MKTGKRQFTSFHLFGGLGILAGIALSLALAASRSLSLAVTSGLAALVLIVFFGTSWLYQVLTGQERLVYYHSTLLVLGNCAFVLWLARLPVLTYLDVTVLGVGLFTAIGRLGCLQMGCCHGRPHAWGVCYREEHVRDGFPTYLVGVRLFPTQAIEAGWTLGLVCVGVGLVLGAQPPGLALALYSAGYAAGRFCLEFTRGDQDRPYFRGLSEAQWTSLALAGGVTLLGAAGLLGGGSFSWTLLFGLAALGVMALAGWLYNRKGEARLWQARHIHEVARLLRQTDATQPVDSYIGVNVASTSQGFQISHSQISRPEGEGSHFLVDHFAFSRPGESISEKTAWSLAGLVLHLVGHPFASYEMVRSSQGIYHLLVRG